MSLAGEIILKLLNWDAPVTSPTGRINKDPYFGGCLANKIFYLNPMRQKTSHGDAIMSTQVHIDRMPRTSRRSAPDIPGYPNLLWYGKWYKIKPNQMYQNNNTTTWHITNVEESYVNDCHRDKLNNMASCFDEKVEILH